MTDIVDHCTRHGIKHFSISSGRLWRDQPISTDPRDMVERGFNEQKKKQ